MSGQFDTPMGRLAAALGDAENGLREAMHAIGDVRAADGTPSDWYDRLGQIESLTRRLADLTDETATRVRRLPTTHLYSRGGSDVARVIELVDDSLRDAARQIYSANEDVGTAWAHIGVLGVRDSDGQV